jgi:membrane protease YdiL (CAAX protease family)
MFGLTVGLFVTLGEEVGWRGFLYHHIKGSFGRRSLIVGLVWGLWYVPLVMQGQFYGEHVYLGALLIVAWAVIISPLIHYCRARTNSVFAAAIFHGTLMAMIQLHGFAGIGATALVTGCLLLYDRHFARDPLIFIRA